jgi:hypothetical protein
VEALRGVELTSTNWSCDLFVLAKANIETNAQNRAKVEPTGYLQGYHAWLAANQLLNNAHSTCVRFRRPKFSGGFIVGVPPDPIPNSEVKLHRADGTARGIRVGE